MVPRIDAINLTFSFHSFSSNSTISTISLLAKVEMFDAIVFHQSNFDWDDLPLSRFTQVIMPISC